MGSVTAKNEPVTVEQLAQLEVSMLKQLEVIHKALPKQEPDAKGDKG